jgi:hypothetical protein
VDALIERPEIQKDQGDVNAKRNSQDSVAAPPSRAMEKSSKGKRGQQERKRLEALVPK